MKHAWGLALSMTTFAVGCSTTKPSNTPPKDVGYGPNSPGSPSLIGAVPDPNDPHIDRPAPPASSMDGYVVRRDVYEVAPIEVHSVRRNGALFAASSRAAIPEQRPRATCRLMRTRYTPRGSQGRMADSFQIEVLQPPLSPFAIDEASARAVCEMTESRGEPVAPRGSAFGGPASLETGGPTTKPTTPPRPIKPQMVGSQVVVDQLRFLAYDGVDGDLLVVRSPDGNATFDRPSFQVALRSAVAMIDDFRKRSH